MNEEICGITNEGKTARNEWKKVDSDFVRTLYSVYEKIRTIFFPYLLYIILLQVKNILKS